MAVTNSVNHSPTFPIPGADGDTFQPGMLETALSALDLDDHSANKGPPVKRINSGVSASRPSVGNAGHVYVATDTHIVYYDDGTTWYAMGAPGVAQTWTTTQTSMTLATPAITTPTITGHLLRAGSAPTIAAGAGIGTGGSPAQTITGGSTDSDGGITLTTGNASTGVILATVTFNAAWGSTPLILLNFTGTPPALSVAASTVTTTTFQVVLSGNAATNTQYSFVYHATSTA